VTGYLIVRVKKKKIIQLITKQKTKQQTMATTNRNSNKTATVATSTTKTVGIQVQPLTYEQIRKQSAQEVEAQELAYDVLDNLNSLQSNIAATQRDLDTAKKFRASMLNTKNVQWNDVAKKDKEIEGYEAGISRLKGLRNTYFPTWKAMVSQD
jgi:hypothetical protein